MAIADGGRLAAAVSRAGGLGLIGGRPRAVLLSFGDPRPLGAAVCGAGVPLICQVQSRSDAELALEAGADVIVAQGAQAGGHGDRRATFTLVPEVADLLAARSPDTLLCAAGGVADGRGLAAATMQSRPAHHRRRRRAAEAGPSVPPEAGPGGLVSCRDGSARAA